MSAKTLASPDRYYIPDDGGHVYDRWGGYHIARDLWERRTSEGRVDWANHDFQLREFVIEDGIPAQWRRRRAVCLRCGEKRMVGGSIRPGDRTLNAEWCVRPTLWQRLKDVLKP
jgi:hypothetical protein